MRVEFTKMHGVGNDFVVFEAPVPDSLIDPARLRALADRRTGIGFDQALVLEAPRRAQSAAYYRIFNADDDEVEQCGNGARCIAALLQRRGAAHDGALTLDSPSGPIHARRAADGEVSVDLGVPDFDPRSLPFEAPTEADRYALEVAGRHLEIGAVSLGNPHAVLIVPSVDDAPVGKCAQALRAEQRVGKRRLEHHEVVTDPVHLRELDAHCTKA